MDQNEEGGAERLRERGLQGGSAERDGVRKALPWEGLLQEEGLDGTAGPSTAARPTSGHLQEEGSALGRTAPGRGPGRNSRTIYCSETDLRASSGGRLRQSSGNRSFRKMPRKPCLLKVLFALVGET